MVRVLEEQIATTISSDGFINFYLLPRSLEQSLNVPQQLQPVSNYDTKGSRLTCLTAVGVGNDRTTVASAADAESEDEDSSSEEESDSLDAEEDVMIEDGIEGEEESEEEEEAENALEESDEENEEEWEGIKD